MKTENYEDLERRIGRAVSSLAPKEEGILDKLWETPSEKASGNEWYLEGTAHAGTTPTGTKPAGKYHGRVFRYAAAAAAMLLIVVLAFWQRRPVPVTPDAKIYLDVNPSLTIEIDQNEKVLNAAADNSDGELILEGMELQGVDVDVAINALIGSMVKNGYLSEAKNFVLLTVEGKDPDKADALRLRLEDAIDRSMQSMNGSAAVFDQVADIDDDLEDLAEQYGITPGKAFLIEQLTASNPQLKYEDLAGMSIAQLYEHLKAAGIDLRSVLNYHGEDLDDDDPAEEMLDELEDALESEIDDDDNDEDDDDDDDDDDDIEDDDDDD